MNSIRILAVALGMAVSGVAFGAGFSPEQLQQQGQALKVLKENVPPQAFEKLSPEQTEKIVLKMIKNASRHVDTPAEDAMQFGGVAIFLLLVIGLPLYLKNRRVQTFQKTLQLMIEKRTPIPSEMIENGVDGSRARRDWRRGIMLVALGGGLIVTLLLQHSSDWGIGWVPMGLGIGSLYLAQNRK